MKDDSAPAPASPRPPADLNPRTDPPLDFDDRDLVAMTPDDYRALGFMAGLEVHQQLSTRRKLFCRCPAGRSVRAFDAEVLRHMRPTLSELGEYDGTALMEFKTRKEIVYRLERGSVCTYEIDDTPPFEIDPEAVRIAVELASLLDLDLVSELHVMRKQYLDGSIPTGFQRTAMIGLAGAIPFREPALGVDRELRIRQLSLEEDSCREVSDVGHRITFRTDRLGMPLTETVTEPELYTPWELQAAGRTIARVARATGEVRRGPGAARQDVNVSVAGGRRIEIKGVDHHRGLPRLVHVEAFRQLNLLRIRDALRRRGIEAASLRYDGLHDVGAIVRRCDYAPIRDALDRGERVAAVRLPGFAGILTRRTQPGVTFAREIADRVRVIACLEGRPFLIHSDLRDYGLDGATWRAIRRRLRGTADDVAVVVWGPERDLETAAREILARAREALDGVPAETRQAFADGTNGFERILPGPDRMYPDTDTPPLPIPDRLVAEIREALPEPPWRRDARYADLGLPWGAARRLAAAPWAGLFDALDPPAGTIARRVAGALERRLPHHRREGRLDGMPDAGRLAAWAAALADGSIRPEAADAALDALLERAADPPERPLARFRRDGRETKALEDAVRDVEASIEAMAGAPRDAALRWAMGRAMARLLGRVDPAEVRRRLEPVVGRAR